MSSPVATLPANSLSPVATPATGGPFEDLDHWLKDFQKYETILAEMVKAASAENKFKDELSAMEQWFKVLSEPERTASVYTMLQHSTQDQIRFYMAVLQQMIKPEERTSFNNVDASTKPKTLKTGLRPPSLNIPLPGSPATPTPITASKIQDSGLIPLTDSSNRLNLPKPPQNQNQTPSSPLRTPALDKSWASMVNTPLVPMFQKPDASRNEIQASDATTGMGILQSGNGGSVGNKGPGLAAINPATLNLLATSGLSNDAQLLAVQLVMSGILQPADLAVTTTTRQDQAQPPQSASKSSKKGFHGNWRAPSSAKYPGSALRSSGPKSSGLKSSGLKSSGLKSSGLDSASMESPRIEDFDPELLKDIPAWLRSLRLHKYNACFEGMTWQEMVELDDAALEKKGVAALGARRRLLRSFDHVRREMGMEGASSATPTTSVVLSSTVSSSVNGTSEDGSVIPKSAAPLTRLSADSPVFMPSGKAPHSAAPIVASATV